MTQNIDFTKLPGRLRNIPDLVREAKKKWANESGSVYRRCPFCEDAVNIINEYSISKGIHCSNILEKYHCAICLCDPEICDDLSSSGIIDKYKYERIECSLNGSWVRIGSRPDLQRNILARFDRMLLGDG